MSKWTLLVAKEELYYIKFCVEVLVIIEGTTGARPNAVWVIKTSLMVIDVFWGAAQLRS